MTFQSLEPSQKLGPFVWYGPPNSNRDLKSARNEEVASPQVPETKQMTDSSVQVDDLSDIEGLMEDLKAQLESAEAANLAMEKDAQVASSQARQQEQTIADLEKTIEKLQRADSEQPLSCQEVDEKEEVLGLGPDKLKFQNFLIETLSLSHSRYDHHQVLK